MTGDDLISIWQQIIVGDEKSWVLFEQGTCVILMQPEADIRSQAVALLKEWGPVQVGTPSADFDIVTLVEYDGWVVTCHHPDILTYVAPDDVGAANNDLMIGLLGRSKRDQDAAELQVIYVEHVVEVDYRGPDIPGDENVK